MRVTYRLYFIILLAESNAKFISYLFKILRYLKKKKKN